MKQLDERGKQCPMPVIETKQALETAAPGESIEVIVDNEIAVQNLTKMANHKQLKSHAEKKSDLEFHVVIENGTEGNGEKAAEEEMACIPDTRSQGMIVVLSSNQMGSGDEALGRLLMKGFVYAISHQDELPEKILLYNSGAFLSCEGSDSVEDLKEMEAQGVEVLTCGTCLNHYHLEDKLMVGGVTNMYDIAESMTKAGKIIRP
ncbi:MAG: sulfurtransferase-like selenium metabolism protein YedF [Clostridia bacterium]|nr:sulfurtransferase-like selenium metabolism protein YedF [Lachnospiraceae bacterium]NCB99907.1 sulfurtransferase-like selenium metabolism protein YedF [Clostridia bacterium]NCD03068.1 sulfurtransferase-like selenium metabolism protein YedF [Clostridia bacterium]